MRKMTQITEQEKRMFQQALSSSIMQLSDAENLARKNGNTELQLLLLNKIQKNRDLIDDLYKR